MNKIVLDPVSKKFSYQRKSLAQLKMDGVALDPITKRFSLRLPWASDSLAELKRETRRMMARVSPDNANGKEIELWEILDRYFPYTYKYVGDFQVRIGKRYPDFININGKKEVVELFGSFWHKPDEIQPTVKYYERYGFSCLIIWEEELKDVDALLTHIRGGSIYMPRYNGSTIFNQHKPVIRSAIQDGLKISMRLGMEQQIAVNFRLMLHKALLIKGQPERIGNRGMKSLSAKKNCEAFMQAPKRAV